MQLKQRTLKQEAVFRGKGLQTGKRSEMICRPSRAGSGIRFTRADVCGCPEMNLTDGLFLEGNTRRTEIGFSGVKLQTLEHFVAALWGLGIDNLKVDVDGPELPAMDGSALAFLSGLKAAGYLEQDPLRRYIKITEPLFASDGERKISVLPDDRFSVSYTIDYNIDCLKKETFRIDLDGESFEKEIAPARTFCMKREALLLFLSGLGRGANFENTLILGKKGPMGTRFRFPNEPVRHKVLDLVGDMYMLGIPVIGRFNCEKSGHAINARILRKIHSKYVLGE